jgi:6-phosphogluconolactonase
VSSSGRFLYASNRGHDTVAVFQVDASSGQLTAIQQVSTGGSWPRNFALDPTGRFLLVANERSHSILSFRVDTETGRLTPTGEKAEIPSPVCIRFR